MKYKRLLLELKRNDSLAFTVQGCEEAIGVIKLDDAYPRLNSAHLILEFIPAINITRSSAKTKSPKKKGVPS